MIFDRAMLIRLADKALTVSKIAARDSASISNAMFVRYTLDPGRANITVVVPFFWARWYHDGRPPVIADPGKKLVWFTNPKDDPRFRHGYPPRRQSDVRKLSAEEFYYYLSQNPSPMVTAERVGRWEGNKFIPVAYKMWAPWVREILLQKLQKELSKALKPLRKRPDIKLRFKIL